MTSGRTWVVVATVAGAALVAAWLVAWLATPRDMSSPAPATGTQGRSEPSPSSPASAAGGLQAYKPPPRDSGPPAGTVGARP